MNSGKLNLKIELEEILKAAEERNFTLLPISGEHIIQLSKIPFIHKDPFDRLLIAAAQSEDITLITIDQNIQQYDLKWIWG
jgi:PIN domain nuclease of toxin-antitoxin system